MTDQANGKPPRWLDCERCQGSGGGPDPENRCPACHGRGQVKNRAVWDEEAMARADYEMDRAKDERAMRTGWRSNGTEGCGDD